VHGSHQEQHIDDSDTASTVSTIATFAAHHSGGRAPHTDHVQSTHSASKNSPPRSHTVHAGPYEDENSEEFDENESIATTIHDNQQRHPRSGHDYQPPSEVGSDESTSDVSSMLTLTEVAQRHGRSSRATHHRSQPSQNTPELDPGSVDAGNANEPPAENRRHQRVPPSYADNDFDDDDGESFSSGVSAPPDFRQYRAPAHAGGPTGGIPTGPYHEQYQPHRAHQEYSRARSKSEPRFRRPSPDRPGRQRDVVVPYGRPAGAQVGKVDMSSNAAQLKDLTRSVTGLIKGSGSQSAASIIKSLKKDPKKMAAVAMKLADIAKLVSGMGAQVLPKLKYASPSVFALLCSPEFLIAGGAALTATVVIFGGYQFIQKKLKDKKGEAIQIMRESRQPAYSEAIRCDTRDISDLNRPVIGGDGSGGITGIESWRRGIAEEHARSVAMSAEGEYITPDALRRKKEMIKDRKRMERSVTAADDRDGRSRSHSRRVRPRQIALGIEGSESHGQTPKNQVHDHASPRRRSERTPAPQPVPLPQGWENSNKTPQEWERQAAEAAKRAQFPQSPDASIWVSGSSGQSECSTESGSSYVSSSYISSSTDDMSRLSEAVYRPSNTWQQQPNTAPHPGAGVNGTNERSDSASSRGSMGRIMATDLEGISMDREYQSPRTSSPALLPATVFTQPVRQTSIRSPKTPVENEADWDDVSTVSSSDFGDTNSMVSGGSADSTDTVRPQVEHSAVPGPGQGNRQYQPAPAAHGIPESMNPFLKRGMEGGVKKASRLPPRHRKAGLAA
jgi:hypothetical protein